MYKKVLVPLDGSKLAECAIPHVIHMARDCSVEEVTLLNVVVIHISLDNIPTEEVGFEKPMDLHVLRTITLGKSRKYLAALQTKLGAEGIKVKTESIEANGPAHFIADYANTKGMDLIIMATHGYTGMKNLMLGSVAFKVLHESHVPVLLIRPESCRI